MTQPGEDYGHCQCGCPLDADGCPTCQPGPNRGRIDRFDGGMPTPAAIFHGDADVDAGRAAMQKAIDDIAFALTKLCPFNAACIEIYPGLEGKAVVKLKSLEGEVQHYTAEEFSRMAFAITSVFRELEKKP